MAEEIVVADVGRLGLRLDLVSNPGVILSEDHQEDSCNNQSRSTSTLVQQREHATHDQKHSHCQGRVLVYIIEGEIISVNAIGGLRVDSLAESVPIRAIKLVSTGVNLNAHVDGGDAEQEAAQVVLVADFVFHFKS